MSRIAMWLRKLLTVGNGNREPTTSLPDHPRPATGDAGTDDRDAIPEIVALEIGPEIDLHPFSPRDVRDVVDAYLREAHARGLREVRVIHGRGRGVQRNIVRSLLARHPLVVSFNDAHPASGGWGATVVVLRDGA